VLFSGAGVSIAGSGIRVEEVHAISNGGDGILCFGGSGHSLRHNEVNLNNGIGINLDVCPGNSIIGNTVSGNTGVGILANCPSVILQNMAFQNGGGDIVAEPAAACTRSDNNPAP
jgi:parallel beta-helix repeat protein